MAEAIVKQEGTLAAAMAAAFAEIEGATKASENAAFKSGGKVSKYADLGNVIAAIKPALINHALFFTQHPEPSDHGVCIETVLHHAGGESLSLGKLFVPANKNDAHGFGSALTYARRYALVTAFGVPVEDDDGNAASKPAAKQAEAMPDAEWSKLVQLVEATNTDAGKLLKNYGARDLRSLTKDQWADAVDILTDRLAKMAKADSNKEAAHV